MKSNARIVVIGSINMDLVVRSARMPAPGETVLGQSFDTVPGGKGANQAVAAARLGGEVEMIGCVGDDDFGSMLREGLQREGISTQFLTSKPCVASGVALIQLDAEGENAITVIQGANGHLKLAEIPGAIPAIKTADVLLVQLEIPLATAIEGLSIGRSADVLTILDPAPVPASELPDTFYLVDVLSPNQHEAEALTGVKVHDVGSARQAAQILQDRGAGSVVIKMGAAGAFVLDTEKKASFLPAFPAKVTDTTAAGDAFTAALATGLASGMDLEAATRMGCAAGSLAVRKSGAQDAMPAKEEVMALLKSA